MRLEWHVPGVLIHTACLYLRDLPGLTSGYEAATPLVRGGRAVAILRHRAGLLDDPGLVREAAARLAPPPGR